MFHRQAVGGVSDPRTTRADWLGAHEYRRRAMSETVATTRPSRVPEMPSLEAYRPKAASDLSPHREKKDTAGEVGAMTEKEQREEGRKAEEGGRAEEEGEKKEEGGAEDEQQEAPVDQKLTEVEVVVEEEADTTEDFARHVRGASTPISDGSPTLDSKQEKALVSGQTFSDTATSEVTVTIESAEVSKEEGVKASVSHDPGQSTSPQES